MKITDKMIEDIVNIHEDYKELKGCAVAYNSKTIKDCLKQKGYEVEEPKSKLEEARKFKCAVFVDGGGLIWCKNGDRLKQIELFEQAIGETINNLICCGNCRYENQCSYDDNNTIGCDDNHSKWEPKYENNNN
jgi:hypothetical protein